MDHCALLVRVVPVTWSFLFYLSCKATIKRMESVPEAHVLAPRYIVLSVTFHIDLEVSACYPPSRTTQHHWYLTSLFPANKKLLPSATAWGILPMCPPPLPRGRVILTTITNGVKHATWLKPLTAWQSHLAVIPKWPSPSVWRAFGSAGWRWRGHWLKYTFPVAHCAMRIVVGNEGINGMRPKWHPILI